MDNKIDIDLEELKRLEEKSKCTNCSDDEHKKIMAYRFAIRLIPDEVYWTENSIGWYEWLKQLRISKKIKKSAIL